MNNMTRDSKRDAYVGDNLSFAASEAYKRLRTNLFFSFPAEQGCRVIGITSATSGEGKSTASVNLAYTLAEAKKRVLLIDCDLRLPRIHEILKVNQVPGLSNFLIGDSAGNGIIQNASLIAGLNVMASGDISPSPTELLSSKRMAGMLEALRKKYEYIIMDLPPVGAVADALIVSKLADGMIMIVREDYADKASINNAVRQLQYHKANILGFVLNDSKHENGYYKKDYKKDYTK